MWYFLLAIFLLTGCYGGPENYYEINEFEEPDMRARQDGWSKNGFLASGGLVTTDPNGGSTQGKLTLTADFSKSNGERGAEYYTVTFHVNPPPPPAGFSASPYNPIATITWNVNGTQVVRRVSVGNGVAVSGLASHVIVEVQDFSTLLPGMVPKPYFVDIAVAPGSRPSTQQPPRLNGGVQHIAVGPATVNIPIPQDSGVISVFLAEAQLIQTALNTQVSFTDGVGNNVGAVNVTRFTGWVPIPSGAVSMAITNLDTVNSTDVSYTWGIEG